MQPASFFRSLLLGASAALVLGGVALAAEAPQPNSWASNGFDYEPPNNGMPGPVIHDKKYPYCVNGGGCNVQPRMGDEHSPLLLPWAQSVVTKWNRDILSGAAQAFVPQSRCWPGNTPLLMVFSSNRYNFSVSKDEYMMITTRGPNVRFVWMDQPHTVAPTPTWLGESIGHYEGDVLVTDTVGIKVHPYSQVDHYRTPHTEQLHVVERYTIAPDKMSMIDSAVVEDPGTFTMKWSMTKNYRASTTPIADMETICAENNDANYFGEAEVPVPQTLIPDF